MGGGRVGRREWGEEMKGKSGEGEVGREGERGDNVSLIVYSTCPVEAFTANN